MSSTVFVCIRETENVCKLKSLVILLNEGFKLSTALESMPMISL